MTAKGRALQRADYTWWAECADPTARGRSWFTPGRIRWGTGAARVTRTAVVKAGSIDVSDGQLYVDAGESAWFAPDPAEHGPFLPVPSGTADVSLLVARDAHGADVMVAAALVAFGPRKPVRWQEDSRVSMGTDAGIAAIGGVEAITELASVRSPDEALEDLAPMTPVPSACERFARSSRATSLDYVQVSMGGDGGYPGAIGLDADGDVTAVVLSTAYLPWTTLGLPGVPPPEAVAVETGDAVG